MKALGLIETKGLLAAVEAADAMVKSADVSIIEKTYVGGGLVTILVTGDVGAVKASIEAGVAAVKKLDEEFLISNHVIPRPHEELDSIIGPNTPPEVLEVPSVTEEVEDETDSKKIEQIEEAKDLEEAEETNVEQVEEVIEATEKTEGKIEKNQDQDALEMDLDELHKLDLENLHKDDIDNLVSKNGIEKTLLVLSKLKVIKLRNLAREYKDFGITGRATSKAGKNTLINKFKLYYEKN